MVAILFPSDVESRVHDEFQQVLNEYAVLKDQEVQKELTPEENKQLSKMLAGLLISGRMKGNRNRGNCFRRRENSLGSSNHQCESQQQNRRQRRKVSCHIIANRSSLEHKSSYQGLVSHISVLQHMILGSVVYMHKGSKVVAKCTRFLREFYYATIYRMPFQLTKSETWEQLQVEASPLVPRKHLVAERLEE